MVEQESSDRGEAWLATLTEGENLVTPEDIEQRETPEGELHLRFYVPSRKEFALPATGIREVVVQSPEMITAIPNASYLLLGTMNLRGQVIWVADLGQFLGETAGVTTERVEIPVIAIEDEETTIGLAVEGIVGMEWLDIEQIPLPEKLPDDLAPYVKGEWRSDPSVSDAPSPLTLLDPSAILRSGRWA